MDPARESLPPAAGDKVYLIDSATWEKLRRLVDFPQVAMDPVQFSYTSDALGVRTYRLTAPGAGGIFRHPFKITVSFEEAGIKYKVAQGSITDGTNGTAISLSGILEENRSASQGYVVLSASVSSALVISGWALTIESSVENTKEVLIAGDPPAQTRIRLLLGKITIEEGQATVTQALFTSVVISTRLLNGVEVKTFDAAPTIATAI